MSIASPEGFKADVYESSFHLDYDKLIGRTVQSISADTKCINLTFVDGETIGLWVTGDCCSHAYWHDLIGVEHLLEGSRITDVVDLGLGTRDNEAIGLEGHQDETSAYALKIVSDHPTWGEVTTVFAYRNDSNGYYGGMCYIGDPSLTTRPITGNVLDVAELETQR